MKPIGILYEHPEWFTPLFAELERRALPYAPILAHHHRFDPTATSAPYSLVTISKRHVDGNDDTKSRHRPT